MKPKAKGTRSKYRAVKVWMCEQGHVLDSDIPTKWCPCGEPLTKFDSKKESRRWLDLRLLEKAGKISDLKRQISFPLVTFDGREAVPILTPKGRLTFYRADFVYRENGKRVIEDTKGMMTDLAALKIAILEGMIGDKVRIS